MTDPIYQSYQYRTLDPAPSEPDPHEYSDLYDDYLETANSSTESLHSHLNGQEASANSHTFIPPTLNSTNHNSYSDDSLDSSFADLTLKTPQLSKKTPLASPNSVSSAQFIRTPSTPFYTSSTNQVPFPTPPAKGKTSNENHTSRVPALLGITTGLKYYKKIRKSIGNAASPHHSKPKAELFNPSNNATSHSEQKPKSPQSPESGKFYTPLESKIPPIPAPTNFNENITDDDIAENDPNTQENTVHYSDNVNIEKEIQKEYIDQDHSLYSDIDNTPHSDDLIIADNGSYDADLVESELDDDDDLDDEEVERLRMQSQSHKHELFQQYALPIISSDNKNDATIITNIEGQSPQVIRKGIQDFKLGKELGEGSYSTVMLGTDIHSGANFAIKILNKRHIIKEKKVKYVNIEKNALNRLGDRNGIIGLHFTFQDASSLYFVLDYAENGELLSLIKRHGTLNESSAKHYTVQLIDAIDYMHSNGVIHRDLKPENILIDKDLRLQITDFGTAKLLDADDNGHYPADTRATSFVGTAEYVSPELLNDKYCGKAADIWSMGCIIFQMIAGKPPFKANNEYQTFQKIQKLQYAFTAGFPIMIRDLIKRILVLKPRERLTIKDIKEHLWFKEIDWNNEEQVWDIIPPELGPYKISAKSMKPMPELDLQYPHGSSTSIQRLKSTHPLTGSRISSGKSNNIKSTPSSSTVTNSKVSGISKKAHPKKSATSAAAAVALYGVNPRVGSSASVNPVAAKPISRNTSSTPSISLQEQQATADLIINARKKQQKDIQLQQQKEIERRRKLQKQQELKRKQQAQQKSERDAQLQKEKEEHDRLVMERVQLDLEAKEREKRKQELNEARRKEQVDQELLALQKERSNQHSQTDSRGSGDVIPGTNIPRPVVNIRIPSRTTPGLKSRDNSSFKIKKDIEVPPLSAIDLKCVDFLKHPDERVLKVGAIEECREFTNAFEKKYKGMIIESPLGYKNKDIINLSSFHSEDDPEPIKLCDLDIDLDTEKRQSNSSPPEPPTSAQKFRNFFTVKQPPVLDNKFVSRRLLITTFGHAMVLKEIIAKDKVKYQLTTQIDLTNPDIKFVEVVGDRKSKNNNSGMLAIISDSLTICAEVDKAEVSQWTNALATSRILEKERLLNEHLISCKGGITLGNESNAFTAATLATQKGSDAIVANTREQINVSRDASQESSFKPRTSKKVRKPPVIQTKRATSPFSTPSPTQENMRTTGAGPMISAAINKAVSLASVNAGVGAKSEQKKITEQNSKFLARSRFH